MTQQRALAIGLAAVLTALWLGFHGGMIAMAPDPVAWKEAGSDSDPIYWRPVPTTTLCIGEIACRFAEAHRGKTALETYQEALEQ